MNFSYRQKLITLFYTTVTSLLFVAVALVLFYKTPHGNMSIYSDDRFFFGLGALNTDQFLTFIIIFALYWAVVAVYTVLTGYILQLEISKSIIWGILLGIGIHVTLSLFDVAVHNIHWSLNYNTYFDPVFIYPLLGFYVVIIFTIYLLISRYIIFSIIDYNRLCSDGIIFFLPIAILSGYSFFQLRFNTFILLLIIVILLLELLILILKNKFNFIGHFTYRISNIIQNEKIFLCSIAIFTLLIRIVFSLANQSGMGADDSPYYSEIGWRYALGENVKDLFFPPGYWMYLGMFYKIFGYNHLLLMILQSFIGTALPLLTYFIAKELFNIKVARLSAILVSINSSIIFYSTIISPESIYVPLTLLLLLLLLKARNNWNILFFIVVGLLLGLSIIIKPVIIIFPFIILGWMFLAYKYRIRRILISWALLAIMTCLVIVPITYRNYINHNRFILTTGFEQIKNTLNNPYLEKAGIYGDSYGEIFNNIINNPIKFSMAFIKGAPLQLRDLFWDKKIYIPFDIVYIHNGSPYAFNLKVYFTLISLSGIFVSIFIERRLWRGRLLPLSLILYYCSMYIFFYGKSRYAMPMLPLIIMFGVFGFYYILAKTKSFFNPVTSSRERSTQLAGKRSRIAFLGGVGSLVLTIYGLNYAHNIHANTLLKDGRKLLETRNYTQAEKLLYDITKMYPNSVSAQPAYHDLIISGVRNMTLSTDILRKYFISYKGLPYTIETFQELIDTFREKDDYYLKRLETSSDLEKFITVLDIEETIIRNISHNYPYASQVTEVTCQFLNYLQNMRILSYLKMGENFLKERMPDLADKKFEDIINMSDQKVLRQWFVNLTCKFIDKKKIHKTLGILYLQYGFHDYALREFEIYLRNYPDDLKIKQYMAKHGRI